MFAEFDKILRSSVQDVNWGEVGVFSATQVLERFELSDWDCLRSNLLITQKDWKVLCIEALSVDATHANEVLGKVGLALGASAR